MGKILHIIKSTFRVKLSVKKETVGKLISVSTSDGDFFLLMILSVLIITFGLSLDNVFLVIGGMMVTPLLYPILATGLGVAIGDLKLLGRSLGGFFVSCSLSVLASLFVSLIVFAEEMPATDILTKIEPRWEYFVVAIFAGIAASITWVRPNLSAALPGVGVTAALVPPLAAIGVGLATSDLAMALRALQLFLISFGGILLSSVVIFFLMDFKEVDKKVEKAVEEEEKKLDPKSGPVGKLKEKVGMED